MQRRNNKNLRIDSSPINYFLRSYFQYVVIPVVILALLIYFIPEERDDSLLVFTVICTFTLISFVGISFGEYYSVKRKVGVSELYLRNDMLYINDKALPIVDITSISPLYYSPLHGKTVIYFLEITTERHTYYFFDKPRLMNLMKSPGIDQLQELFPILKSVIMEERHIYELPGTSADQSLENK